MGGLLLTPVAVVLLVLGVGLGSTMLLVSSTAVSLLAVVALLVRARRAAPEAVHMAGPHRDRG